MAALVSTTPLTRHVIGDLSTRFYTLSGTNGDTLVTGLQSILNVTVTPTTAVAVGVTTSGGTVTFVTGGAWSGVVQVVSRVG